MRGDYAFLRVLENETVRGRDAQVARRLQKNIRRRFDLSHVEAADDDIEKARDPKAGQNAVNGVAIGRRSQGDFSLSMKPIDELQTAIARLKGRQQEIEIARGFAQAQDVRIEIELSRRDPIDNAFARAHPVLAVVGFVEGGAVLE